MGSTKHAAIMSALSMLLSIAATACIKDARECANTSSCFTSEQCIDGACQLAAPSNTLDQDQLKDMAHTSDMATPRDMTAPDLGGVDHGHTSGNEPKPLPRARYLNQTALDAGRLISHTRCALRVDTKSQPHAAYIVRDPDGDAEHLRYQVRAGERWLSFIIGGKYSYYVNPSLTLDSNDQAHICVVDPVDEQLYYIRRQGDALVSEPVSHVGNVVSDCAITATAQGLIIVYTAQGLNAGDRTLSIAHKTYEETQWELGALDADQHDVASVPALTQRADAITLWYHATQGGQTYWRKASWPKDRLPMPSDFSTKRARVGTPLPFIQVSQRPQARDHVMLHTEEFIEGQELQVLTYWDTLRDDLIIEGTVSPRATSMTLSKDEHPSVLFNASDGALYLAEANALVWTYWALTQTNHDTYADCAAIESDDQGALHLIYQTDAPNAINYHKLAKP